MTVELVLHKLGWWTMSLLAVSALLAFMTLATDVFLQLAGASEPLFSDLKLRFKTHEEL